MRVMIVMSSVRLENFDPTYYFCAFLIPDGRGGKNELKLILLIFSIRFENPIFILLQLDYVEEITRFEFQIDK